MPSRSKLSFDELNILSEEDSLRERTRRSIPYREFFGDMYLEPEEKEKRIAMAEALDDVFLFLFALIMGNGGTSELLTFSYLYETAEKKYWDAISAFIVAEASDGRFEAPSLSPLAQRQLENNLKDFIARQSRLIVDATVEHLDDEYFTSEDRAQFVAENQVNGVGNMVDNAEASDSGMRFKTWETMHDNRVRDTHDEVDGVTVSINEPFHVGDSELMYPGDDSLGADASEIVNCRCTVSYSGSLSAGEDSEVM